MSGRLTSIITLLCIGILLYTRLVNLDWGLPYPMHPDERNMADAVMRLTCDDPRSFVVGLLVEGPANMLHFLQTGRHSLPTSNVSCLNPDFFAYGQLSLYLGYGLSLILHGMRVLLGEALPGSALTFWDAVMGLRIISALASCLTVVVSMRIIALMHKQYARGVFRGVAFLALTFSPVLIQFAHFGTTESLLMAWYTLLVYRALIAFSHSYIQRRDLWVMSGIAGLAIATKFSAVLFLAVPGMVLLVKTISTLWQTNRTISSAVFSQSQAHIINTIDSSIAKPLEVTTRPRLSYVRVWIWFVVSLASYGIYMVTVAGITAYIFSPHNLISLRELLGSMQYESDVALGTYVAFYTRQFLYELPLVFHAQHVFPVVLGQIIYGFAVLGLLILPYRRSCNVLRFAVVLPVALTMGWYAKWTRFLAPVYPMVIIVALVTLAYVYEHIKTRITHHAIPHTILRITGVVFVAMIVVPGIAFLSVYTTRDVRFVASDWVYQHVKPGSIVLSETANVIDVPVPDIAGKKRAPDAFSIQYISFNFYDLDTNLALQAQLREHVAQADYIFVPSRRVFYNHTCVELDGTLTTTRHSAYKCAQLERTYPALTTYYKDLFSGKLGFEKVAEFTSYPRITLFGKTIISFPDEEAEETFTVFDHPVMRIYKRVEVSLSE